MEMEKSSRASRSRTGLISRDYIHMHGLPPTERIREVRSSDPEECSGSSAQLGQIWREQHLFHEGEEEGECDAETESCSLGSSSSTKRVLSTSNWFSRSQSQVLSHSRATSTTFKPPRRHTRPRSIEELSRSLYEHKKFRVGASGPSLMGASSARELTLTTSSSSSSQPSSPDSAVISSSNSNFSSGSDGKESPLSRASISRASTSSTFVHQLAQETLCSVLMNLNVRSILFCRRTCRKWHIATYQPSVWSINSSLSVVSEAAFRAISFSSVSMLRELELSRCHALVDDDLALITVCQSLTLLDLSYCTSITDRGIELIAQLYTLQILALEGCHQLTDASVLCLSSLTSLHSLSLSFLPLTDIGLAGLESCVSLEFLQLCFCNGFRGQGLRVVRALPRLINLNVGHTLLKDADLEALRESTSISTLNLESCEVTDAGMDHLFGLPLSSLDVHEVSELTDVSFERFADAWSSTLTSLCLSYNENLTDRGMKGLAKLTRLTVLELPECLKITDEGLDALATCPGLTSLDLTGDALITDEGVIRMCQHLQKLGLLNLGFCVQLTDRSMEAVGTLRSLVSLELNSCTGLTNLSIQYLSECTQLRTLSLSDVHLLDDRMVDFLLYLHGLDALCVSGTLVTIRGLRKLFVLPHLRELNAYKLLTEAEVEELRQESQGIEINI